MKQKKTFIALLLCAVTLIAAAVPAFAILWQGSDSFTLTSIGVSADCIASALAKKANASITLTYLPDPSNHLPESDYTTKVNFKITNGSGQETLFPQSFQVGMTGYFHQNTTYTIAKVKNLFYVNGTHYTTITLG